MENPNNQQTEEEGLGSKKISRRKLLASIGATGVATLVTGSFLTSGIANAYNEDRSEDNQGKEKKNNTVNASDVSYQVLPNKPIRALDVKLREYISVTDFGATGNGVTDDSAAFQAAFDSFNCIKVPKGTYKIGTQIVIRKSSFSMISEEGAVFLASAAMNALFYSNDNSNIVIDGGEFNGAGFTTSNIHFRTVAASPGRIVIKNTKQKATKVDPGLMYGCITFDSLGGKASSFRHQNIVIEHNRIEACGTHGALVAYCDGVVFRDNEVDGAQNHGFEAVNCRNVTETGNRVGNCGVSALGVGDNCYNFMISNNVIYNCGGDGSITVEHNSVFGTVCDNTISDAHGSSGINVSFGTPGQAPFDNLNNITIRNNNISGKSGTQIVGILVYSSIGGTAKGKNVIVQGNNTSHVLEAVDYNYCDNGVIANNTLNDPVGSTSKLITLVAGDGVLVSGNRCYGQVADHGIVLKDYAWATCNYCTITDNYIFSAGADASKSVVFIEGTGLHIVSGNMTQGSASYVNAPDASKVTAAGNSGPLTVKPYIGANIVAVGSGNSADDQVEIGGKRHTYGMSAPASGSWQTGEIVWNTSPSPNGNAGWICTVGGTPGTWKTFGAISS